MNVSLYEIANMMQGVVVGDEKIIVSSISPIDDIAAGSLVFADGPRNLLRAEQSDAAAIIVDQQTTSAVKSIIQVAHPFKTFINLL